MKITVAAIGFDTKLSSLLFARWFTDLMEYLVNLDMVIWFIVGMVIWFIVGFMI